MKNIFVFINLFKDSTKSKEISIIDLIYKVNFKLLFIRKFFFCYKNRKSNLNFKFQILFPALLQQQQQ